MSLSDSGKVCCRCDRGVQGRDGTALRSSSESLLLCYGDRQAEI